MTEIQNSTQVLGILMTKPNERTLPACQPQYYGGPVGTRSVLVIGY